MNSDTPTFPFKHAEKSGSSERPQVVLFTGGRDSTLTSSLLMMRNIPVCLLSADSGCSVHKEITSYRLNEFSKRFGESAFEYKKMDVCGTFRSIALESIEADILKYKKNLIVLGEKLAIMVHAIDFCKRNNYETINVGYTKYQEDFPEQRSLAINFFKNFLNDYKIKYALPIYKEATNIEYVKYKLMQIGLSNKPLEGSTLFGDTFSRADDATIEEYLKEKEQLAKRHLEFLSTGLLS